MKSKRLLIVSTGITLLGLVSPVLSNTVNASTVNVERSNGSVSVGTWQTKKLSNGTVISILPLSTSGLTGKVNYNKRIYNYYISIVNGTYTFYLNGQEVYSINIANNQIPFPNKGQNPIFPFINFTYANGRVAFRHGGRRYYYLTTEKYDGNTLSRMHNAIRDIVLGLAGFIPVVGPYISGGSIAYSVYNDLFGRSQKNKWYTVKEYCTRGYEYYAWKTYTYRDASRRHLESIKWEYRKIL